MNKQAESLSPYSGLCASKWLEVTERLLKEHPLKRELIVEVVLEAWGQIFKSKIGRGVIGVDILPKPQIMGFLLHELIPLELAARFPKEWRGDKNGGDKDIVYIPDDKYSIEVKTSSHAAQIFGNRSYAQETTKGKKAKDGYYLCINFEGFGKSPSPSIAAIRFGWIDSTDWRGQKAASGQQSNLSPEVYQGKLVQLFKKK